MPDSREDKMQEQQLKEILQAVQQGELSAEEAQTRLLGYENLGFARVDHSRSKRSGFPEVIYGAGKTDEQILTIAAALKDRGAKNILCTRARESARKLLKERLGARIYEQARIAVIQRQEEPGIGSVLVMCAGTSDLPVAEEAAVTAEVMGAKVLRVHDAGVAGIHRLMAHQDEMAQANVIVCVAGMEGALPSVVAGLTDRPILAVPTSVGYGASFGGLAALLAMLNSCGSGVSVVNIDNGFGAGYQAALINRMCCKGGENL
jgi:NCAIR mutase (PurE)-related protein